MVKQWNDRFGGVIPTESAAAIIAHRTGEYKAEVAEIEADISRTKRELALLASGLAVAKDRLEYWEQTLAVVEEVDRRLAAGEKVELGDGGT